MAYPFANTLTTVDDMRHAAFNARGLYLPGQNPQQLIDTLTAALADIGSRTGAASAADQHRNLLKVMHLYSKAPSTRLVGHFSAFLYPQRDMLELRSGKPLLIPQANQRNLIVLIRMGHHLKELNLPHHPYQLPKNQSRAEADKIIGYIRGIQTPSSSRQVK